VLRARGWSVRVDGRACTVSALLLGALVTVGCWSISVGDFPIPIRDVVRALVGEVSPDSRFIVESIRLPRVVTGVLVGGAFGVSGAIFQSLAQNRSRCRPARSPAAWRRRWSSTCARTGAACSATG
jgi:iron complex transport system permease protein